MSLLGNNATKEQVREAHVTKIVRKKALRKLGKITPGFSESPRTSPKWAIRQLKELARRARVSGQTVEQYIATGGR